MQFLLSVFYQEYKKDLGFIKFFRARKFHALKYKNFDAGGGEEGGGRCFFSFLSLFWKSGPVTSIYHYLLKYGLLIKTINHKR